MKNLWLLLLLAGCTMDGKASGPETDQVCTDTRDGETWIMVAGSAHNGRYGIGADSCLDVQDSTGRVRTVCKSHEVWMKCVPVQPEPSLDRQSEK